MEERGGARPHGTLGPNLKGRDREVGRERRARDDVAERGAGVARNGRPDGVHGVQGVGARGRRAGGKRGAAFPPDCFRTPLLTVVPFRRPPTLLPAAQAPSLLKRADRLQTTPSLLPVAHGGRHLP